MTHEDQVRYLANVFNIAAIDGTVGSAESTRLKGIIRHIGATSAAVEEARQMVIQGNYQLQALSDHEDSVDNIEDMVLVALADGQLTAEETGPIEKISDMMKLSQQAMDAIVQRAQHRLVHPHAEDQRPKRPARVVKTAPPVPPKAKTPPVPPTTPRVAHPKPPPPPPKESAKPFRAEQHTPKRGGPRPAPPPEPAFEPPATGLVLHFSGVMPERAHAMLAEISEAEASGEYREAERTWYYAVWNVANIANAAALALRVYSLTNRRVHLDGRLIEWSDLFAFCPCAASRQMSDAPEAYCFGAGEESLNIWGCKMAAMDWSGDADWFTLGKFTDDKTFVFDKVRIRETLEERMKSFCYCPFVNEKLMQAALDRLPAQARVTGRWKLRAADPSNPHATVKTIRESVHGCVMEYDAPVDGMAPTDWRDATRLIRSAARDGGVLDLDTKTITPLGAY